MHQVAILNCSFNNHHVHGGPKLKSRDETDDITRDRTLFSHKSYYAMNDIFHREDERLKTFDNWPLEWLDKRELAMTGMFFTGDGDKVKCYFCEVEIGCWDRDDTPLGEHMRWSPNCPLLRRRTTNNQPIDIEALDRQLPALSYDVCGASDATMEMRRNAFPEGTIPAGSMVYAASNGMASSSSSGGCAYYPEYPEYAVESVRERSFAEWPRNMKQKPAQLAEAGFFYTGVGDRVKCFSCGGGLKDWDDSDDPWEQHALWLSKCRYLRLIKGQSYIDSVVLKFKESEKASEEQQAAQTTTPSETSALRSTESAATAASQQQTAANDEDQVQHGAEQNVSESNGVICNSSSCSSRNCSSSNGCASEQSNNLANGIGTENLVCAAPAVLDVEKKCKSNSSISEDKLCKICYVNEYNTAFLGCGHVVACAKCASSVTKCPVCREQIKDIMRVYFP